MKSLEYAQLHLQNVQQQIQTLNEQKAQIEQNIARMEEFLVTATEEIRNDQASVNSWQTPAETVAPPQPANTTDYRSITS